MLRPFNTAANLKQQSGLTKKELPLPKELWNNIDLNHFNNIIATSGALSIALDNQKHVLNVIGTDKAVNRATLLAGMAFKHLSEIQKLHQKSLSHKNDIQTLQQRLQDGYVDEFTVPKECNNTSTPSLRMFILLQCRHLFAFLIVIFSPSYHFVGFCYDV